MLFTVGEYDFVKLNPKLTKQEISTGTFLLNVILTVCTLALNIVVHIVIDVIDEEIIDLLERAHLILAIVFKVFLQSAQIKVANSATITIFTWSRRRVFITFFIIIVILFLFILFLNIIFFQMIYRLLFLESNRLLYLLLWNTS